VRLFGPDILQAAHQEWVVPCRPRSSRRDADPDRRGQRHPDSGHPLVAPRKASAACNALANCGRAYCERRGQGAYAAFTATFKNRRLLAVLYHDFRHTKAPVSDNASLPTLVRQSTCASAGSSAQATFNLSPAKPAAKDHHPAAGIRPYFRRCRPRAHRPPTRWTAARGGAARPWRAQ